MLPDPLKLRAHLFVVDHLRRGLEDELAPALNEGVGLRCGLHDLRLELLLRGEEAVPQVVADGALLQEPLESWLVLTKPDDALHVGHCATHERGFEQIVRGWRVRLLEQGDIDVAFFMSGKVWLDDLVCIDQESEGFEHRSGNVALTESAPSVDCAEDPETAEYDEYVEHGNEKGGHYGCTRWPEGTATCCGGFGGRRGVQQATKLTAVDEDSVVLCWQPKATRACRVTTSYLPKAGGMLT